MKLPPDVELPPLSSIVQNPFIHIHEVHPHPTLFAMHCAHGAGSPSADEAHFSSHTFCCGEPAQGWSDLGAHAKAHILVRSPVLSPEPQARGRTARKIVLLRERRVMFTPAEFSKAGSRT